jgi:hypothetical protein
MLVTKTAVAPCLFAALTTLTFGDYFTFRQHHVLPPNLLELSAGNVAAASCLLPLKQLRQPSLSTIEHEVAPAEELLQLTSLTALTHVDLTYWAEAQLIDTAAAGCRALKLHSLHLLPSDHGSFARDTLLQLAHLTSVQSLMLNHCRVGELEPHLLAAALGGMRRLSDLSLYNVCWGEDAAANASGLASLLRSLASRRRAMPQLSQLTLDKQHVSRAAANALSKMRGLLKLQIKECQIEDSSVADIALGLGP